MTREDRVVGQYKGSSRKTSPGFAPQIFVSRFEFSETSARTNWTDAYWSYQRKQIVFSFSYSHDGCKTSYPTSIDTFLYRFRTLSCAPGWTQDTDASTQYCFRQLPTSSCTVGNPISLGDQNKLLTEVDLPIVSSRSLQLLRRYSVVGRYTIGTREATFHQEDLGLNWRTNFAHRVEPARATSASTSADAAVVSRGLDTSFFRIAASSSGPRTEFLPFNRYQKDRLQVERDSSGLFVKAFYTSADNVLEEYQGGRLVRSTNPDGNWRALSYRLFIYSDGTPGDLKLDRVADPFGRQLIFEYSHSNVTHPREGLLIGVTDVDGQLLKYNYVYQPDPALGSGMYTINLASVTQRDGTIRRYAYGETSNFPTYGPVRATSLTGLFDERGVRVGNYKYEQSGRAYMTESAGGVNRYTVGGSNYTDPLGTFHNTVTTTTAAGLSRISTWYQPAGAGCTTSWSNITYDANANVSSATTFNGAKVCYVYDLSRNLETKRLETISQYADCTSALNNPPTGSRVISTQWHPDWRLETRIAEPNKLTTTVYNGQGATCAPSTVLVDGKPPAVVCSRSEQATTDATGALGFAAGLTGTPRTWSYTYTTYGRVLTATDPNGKTTTTSYYPDDDPDMGRRGNVATITNAANHVTRFSAYNLHGQPTQIVDPNGLVTDLTYDLRLRLTRAGAPGSRRSPAPGFRPRGPAGRRPAGTGPPPPAWPWIRWPRRCWR